MNMEQIQIKALVKLSIVILREQSRVLQAFRPGERYSLIWAI